MIAKDIVEKMEILATQSIYDNLTTLFELYEIKMCIRDRCILN